MNLMHYSYSELEEMMPMKARRARFPADLEAAFRAEYFEGGHNARLLLLALPLLLFSLALVFAPGFSAEVPRPLYLTGLLVVTVSALALALGAELSERWYEYADTAMLFAAAFVGLTVVSLSVVAEQSGRHLPYYMGVAYPASVFLLARINARRGLMIFLPLLPVLLGLQFLGTQNSMLKVGDLNMQALVFAIGVIGERMLATQYRSAWLRLRMLEATSRTDPLTGILNRRGFDEAFGGLLRAAARDKKSIALLVLDIDFFKKLNDRYGHEYGDVCLKAIGQLLRGFARRPLDQAARFGGEEFVLSLYDCPPAKAHMRSEELRRAIEQLGVENLGSTVSANVTVSIGATCAVPSPELTPIDLIRKADLLLYVAKNAGRNQVKFAELQAP